MQNPTEEITLRGVYLDAQNIADFEDSVFIFPIISLQPLMAQEFLKVC